MASTSELLPPSVDPEKRQIGIRNLQGRNDGGTRTVIRVRHFDPVVTDEPDSLGGTNTASSPLELLLASFVGCEGVIINGVAKAMKFDYEGVDFECSGQIDIRGPKGVSGIRPYFETVELKITLHTDEPSERVEKLVKNVEHRCPVMNLMRSAEVDLKVEWVTKPAMNKVKA